ncbi:LysR substrate-binding domain-containing protein [Paracidovorax valerianellae]|uniref:DNA-binding transcriptional regulator, LysR family n=1 Tax=Paracidovorax valerianellae TaxID=187868 RepID=A0A1G7F711_9BURK|nr:LysR substrate-binding domain-containing protein [Paracidovorax valerianellae]MDA8443645.1 LysR substrate-binding domain-containing protein [Paracidovorax valerianellae]SDE71718.1 DNA-binding transcriptional regulator, LysR family [Paracidovorax valerianellae]
MQFDLTDLRLYVCVAEMCNLTRAAAKHNMSLAAASTRIKALEMQAGVLLLAREARGVRLLPAGEAFVHHARLMLQQADLLHAEMGEYGGGLRGHLRLLANTTAVTDFLPEILADFLSDHPHVNVELEERPNAMIPRGVLEGRADLGIIAGSIDTLGLVSIHFSTDRLVLVTSPSHRFARRRSVNFAETLEEDVVGMPEGSTLQAFLDQITQQLGHRQKLRIRLRSFEAMCRMISSNVGIGVLPESAVIRNQLAMPLAMVELRDEWSVRERHLLMRDRATLPVYAQALVDNLCRHYDAGRLLSASPPQMLAASG